MLIRSWFRTPRVRRSLAAATVILSAGGLVLARSPSSASAYSPALLTSSPDAKGKNTSSFSGPGAHGAFSLSHTRVLAGGEQRVFAQLNIEADPDEQRARERAPLSMAIVLDTSGSMSGDKIEQAKQSVIRLLRDMRADDEVAFVRYSSDSELIQPLARVGAVREALIARVQSISADGGTNIPPALSMAIGALSDAGKGRVRRVILASDGLDSTRVQSETIARESAGRGITTSSMGIGLDFDEGYMGGVAQAGHGNFAFVKDASALATFLKRELEETASTTVEGATARVELPAGVRFVRAVGADAKVLEGNTIELSVGSLFAGDARRVVLELAATIGDGEARAIRGQVTWRRVGGDESRVNIAALTLAGSTDANAVAAGQDGEVLAGAMSAVASLRQVEAAEAYRNGDGQRAQALIDQNLVDLRQVAAAAPAAAATSLMEQAREYEGTKQTFAQAPPSSTTGKAAAKKAAAKEFSNMARKAY